MVGTPRAGVTMAETGREAPKREGHSGLTSRSDSMDTHSRVTFRRFARGDVETVRDLLWRVWTDAYTDILGPAGVEKHCANLHTRYRLRELARPRDTHCNLVAELDGRVIAFASAILHWNGVVDIYEVYVDTPYQGMGLGTRLIQAAFHRFPGARSWRIEVLAQNTAAIALYERLGFTRSGARPDWHQADITVLQMTRPGDPTKSYGAGYLLAVQARAALQWFFSLA